MTVASEAPPDLSAVVVNFQSADYTLGLIDTLRGDRFEIDGRPGRLEITVVDNASRGEDVARLAPHVGSGVRLIRNTENAGYALANNQGFRVSSGKYHMVVNPDVRVRPGSISELIRALETLPDAGLVGPIASMDEEGAVLLPPNELPDPWREALTSLARMYRGAALYNARLRARFAHRYWRSEEPLDLDMLSGGCFLGRRKTFLEHGLFDGGYPLYYEDTDLFRRLRGRGLKLWSVPSVRIVHFFSRSAITRMKAALFRHGVSAARYFGRWFGPAGARVLDEMRARADAAGREDASPWSFEDLVAKGSPPSLPIGAVPGEYLEIAGNPQFTLAAGIFPGRSGPFEVPAGFFQELGDGTYWMRTVDPSTSDTLRVWRILKTPDDGARR
jgi:GT2 family glycosyltransferase